MNVTDDVSWHRAFARAPIGECFGKEFEFAARRGKAALDLAIDSHAGKATSFRVAIWTGNRNHVRRRWLRCAREHTPESVFANIVKLGRGNVLFVDRSSLLLNFECAITSHEFKWRQIFRRSVFR